MCCSQLTAEVTKPEGERAELVLTLPKAEKDTRAAMCKDIPPFNTVAGSKEDWSLSPGSHEYLGATDGAHSPPNSG